MNSIGSSIFVSLIILVELIGLVYFIKITFWAHFIFMLNREADRVHKVLKKRTNERDQLLIDDYRYYKNPVTKEEGVSAKFANFLRFTRHVDASKRNILTDIDELNYLPNVNKPKIPQTIYQLTERGLNFVHNINSQAEIHSEFKRAVKDKFKELTWQCIEWLILAVIAGLVAHAASWEFSLWKLIAMIAISIVYLLIFLKNAFQPDV